MLKVMLNSRQGEPNAFEIYDDDGKAGEMIFDISGSDLTVYHTEVEPKKEGKGYAKVLLDNLVDFVRQKKLMVIPMCPYVHVQFQRHPNLYNDIWNKIRES